MFCAKMSAFIEQYQTNFQEAISCGKEIFIKSKDLASSVEGLGKALDALSELQKVIKEDRLQKIFKELSKTVFETGDHFIESGELIKLYCSSHLKFHLQETESF